MRQIVDINAAGGDVGGDQCADVTALEALKRLGAGSLALVAVQGHGVDAGLAQVLGHVVGAKLGAREDQHLAPVVLLDDVRQQGFLLAAAHRVDGLCDALHRGVARRDLDALRVAQQAASKVTNLVAEGGREQQTLLVLGHQRDDLLHVMDKAHVEHAVGFVEHQNLHGRQVQEALLLQIQQAARRGHQNVHAALDLGDLGVHADPAKDHGGVQLEVLAVGADGFLHLRGEFAGGRKHQRTGRATAKFALAGRACAEFVQQRQGEGRGLAGARLGAGQQVMALQHGRDGLCLDGRGDFITLLVHGFQDGRSQVQIVKVHDVVPVRGTGNRPVSAVETAKPVKGRWDSGVAQSRKTSAPAGCWR